MVSSAVEYRGRVTAAPAARPTVTLLIAAVVTVGAATGFSGGSKSPAAAPTPTLVQTPTCPVVTPSPSSGSASAKILRSLPADLPLPPGLTPVRQTTTSDGVRIVQFTT